MTLERDLGRRARIIRLLQTRDDGLPEARWTNTQPPERGFSNDVLAPESCPDCLANGVILRTCETCRGEGVIEYRRRKDPMDDPIRNPPPDPRRKAYFGGDAGDQRVDRARAIDAAVAAAERELQRHLAPPTVEDLIAEANKHPEQWEIERKRMYRQFDYAALDRALELLRQHDQEAYHLTHGIYIYGWIEPSTTVEVAVERGLRQLDGWMPEFIRAPGDEFKTPMQKRWERRHAA